MPLGPAFNQVAAQQAVALMPLSVDLRPGESADRPHQLQIGVGRTLETPVEVNARTVPPDKWSVLTNGWRIYSVDLLAAGAMGMRLHLQNVALPPGTQVVIYDPAKPATNSPLITPQSLAGQTEIWTSTLFSERAVLELQAAPGADLKGLTLTLVGISHLYPQLKAYTTIEGACHNDATCYPAFASEAAGVARMAYIVNGNTYVCTGSLIAGQAGQGGGLFLTAHHCVSTGSVASTVELYWFFQTSACDEAPPALTSVPVTSGADLLATDPTSDFTLLQLRQSPPGGTYYLGWSTNAPAPGETLTCIHHPMGTYKRISFGNYYGADPDFWAVQWFSGVTEDGSSGSPLLNANHQIIGQLNGGYGGPGSSCSAPSDPDQFGRFDVTYASIKKWLGTNSTPGQFTPVKGTYTGLFSDSTNGVAQASAGAFTLSSTVKGRFSGQVRLGASRYSFTGTFDTTGAAAITLSRRKLSPLAISLQCDPSDTDHLTGTVSDGTWLSQIDSDRGTYDGRASQPRQFGQYTWILPGDPSTTASPGGDSYGTTTISKSGQVHFSGSLADNTSISQSATLSKTGRWPFYVPLYSGSQGSLFGWVFVTNADTTGFSSAMTWSRPALPRTRYYPGGFTNQVPLSGAFYVRPGKGTNFLNQSNAGLALNGQNLLLAVSNSFALSLNNRVTNLGPNRLSLSFSTSSGGFSGSIVNPNNRKSVSFRGMMQQNPGTASGYFLLSNQSGQVLIAPPDQGAATNSTATGTNSGAGDEVRTAAK